MVLFTVVQHLWSFDISRLLIYHQFPNVWNASCSISASIFVDVPYWLPYSMDKCIFCVVPVPPSGSFTLANMGGSPGELTLIVPRAWEIGYTQRCIKCQGKTTTHFVYFWGRKTLPYTHPEATSYIPQQGQSLHFWTTSLFTTGCYKNKYTIQLLRMACISRFATTILSGETELALGTIMVKLVRNILNHLYKEFKILDIKMNERMLYLAYYHKNKVKYLGNNHSFSTRT